MKTQNSDLNNDIFNEFLLSTEEMICVRGGEGDPVTKPGQDPIKI